MMKFPTEWKNQNHVPVTTDNQMWSSCQSLCFLMLFVICFRNGTALGHRVLHGRWEWNRSFQSPRTKPEPLEGWIDPWQVFKGWTSPNMVPRCSIMLHLWNIYLQNWVIYGVNGGTYSIHGAHGYHILHAKISLINNHCVWAGMLSTATKRNPCLFKRLPIPIYIGIPFWARAKYALFSPNLNGPFAQQQ